MSPPGATASAPSSLAPKPDSASDRLPPFNPASFSNPPAKDSSDDDLLPPGTDALPPASSPVENKQPKPVPKKPTPVNAPSPDLQETVDDLLPPGVADAPSFRPASSDLESSGGDDDLLPHAATEATAGSGQPQLAMREVPLPTMSENLTKKVVNPEFSVREPTRKIIQVDGEEIELRVLSPEEKAKRRRKRNLIVISFAIVTIAIIVWVVTS